jgi:hypothetical protein
MSPSALIVGTVALSLEEAPNARIGVDGYREVDRVDLVLDGFGELPEVRIALTRSEAKKLAAYLALASEGGA